jgi:hypothetical protein
MLRGRLLVLCASSSSACLPLVPGEVDAQALIEAVEPDFACVDADQRLKRLTLQAGGVARVQLDGSDDATEGEWSFADGATLRVDAGDALSDTMATVTTFGMVLQTLGDRHECAAFHYAGDDGRDATFDCTSLNQPGTVFETTTVVLTARAGLSIERETTLQGGEVADALTSTFAGVYRVDGNDVFAAWGNDDNEIETLVGSFDGDALVVPDFVEPRCPAR